MKKRAYIFFALLFVVVSIYGHWYVGLRDNRFALLGYEAKSGWSVGVEHSFFSEKIGFQYFKWLAGYDYYVNSQFVIFGGVYIGTTYSTNFYNTGANIKFFYSPIKWLGVEALINPHYDSDYKYETCWSFYTNWQVFNEVSLLVEYTNVPEYRISEQRIRSGLEFRVNNLSVIPMISIPTEGPIKTMRVLIGMKYKF